MILYVSSAHQSGANNTAALYPNLCLLHTTIDVRACLVSLPSHPHRLAAAARFRKFGARWRAYSESEDEDEDEDEDE